MEVDIWLFNLINQLESSWLATVLSMVHYLSFIICFCLGIYLLLGYPNQRIQLLQGAGTIVASYVIGLALKYLVARPRPLETIEDAIVRADYSFASFPSNQVAVFFALATVLLLLFKKKRYGYLALGVGVLVGISRVYLGAHYPSDVIGGIILGILVPVLYFKLLLRSKFKA